MVNLRGLLFLAVVAVAANGQSEQEHGSRPYCNLTETIVKNTTVIRTREKSRFYFWKKKETYEEVVPQISVRSVLRCCEGFKMDEVQHLCLPHCELACPENADCWQPEVCKCRSGYKEIQEHLIPDVIRCEPLKSLTHTGYEQESTSEYTNAPELVTRTGSTDESNEQFSTVGYMEVEMSTEFESDLPFDCNRNECPENARCQMNGSCICMPDFEWHEVTTTNFDDGNLVRYASCLLLNENVAEATDSTENSPMNLAIVYIVLGVVVVFGLIAFLAFNFARRTDSLDVEGKRGAHCKYISSDDDATTIVAY